MRENTDQNNAEYGNILGSVLAGIITYSQNMWPEKTYHLNTFHKKLANYSSRFVIFLSG